MKLASYIGDFLVAVKIHGVTCLRSHYLGVTLQYWSDDSGLIIKSLALVDTQARNDSAST